jgi:hypothetical protein
MQNVAKDRAALEQLIEVGNTARHRLMESTYALASLATFHKEVYGEETLPSIYGVPPDLQELFSETLDTGTKRVITTYNESNIAGDARSRYTPFTNSDISTSWADAIEGYNDMMLKLEERPENAEDDGAEEQGGQFGDGDAPDPSQVAGPSSHRS